MANLFPEEDLTSYHGSQIVPAMFALLTVISTVRSLVHIWKKDGGAQSIASVPLDKYPANAANTIILMFAYWGQSQLLMAVVHWVVLWKYRSLLPFAILLFSLEWSMRLAYQLRYVAGKQTLFKKRPPGAAFNSFFPLVGWALFYFSL